jgi:hypothetical protein
MRLIARPFFPRRGIAAGYGSAVFELKAHLLFEVLKHCVVHPRTAIYSHVDDIIQEGTEGFAEGILGNMTASAFVLANRCFLIGLPLADPKLRALGSSRGLRVS